MAIPKTTPLPTMNQINHDTRPIIKCPRCDGKGKVQLGDELNDTLNALRRRGECSATELHKDMGVQMGVTAVNNRLTDLLRLKLVTRLKRGMTWIYKAVAIIACLFLTGCVSVPKTEFTFDPRTHKLTIKSPKNVELRGLNATISTNGVLTVTVETYTSKNDWQVVQAVMEAQTKIMNDMSTRSQELINKAAVAAGGGL